MVKVFLGGIDVCFCQLWADMVIFMTQQWLPLNPQKLPNCSWDLAFMQAWSFTCNADWHPTPAKRP